MHAVIRGSQANRFRHLLREGLIFLIKNFKVTATMADYRPINSTLKILFLLTTSLKQLEDDIVDIPINGFEFLKRGMLDERVNNNSILSDVVGCLCGIGYMESVGSKLRKRDIRVITDYGVKSKITLWEELGEKFDPYLYSEVSFTPTSKIYINLRLDYITFLTEKFATSAGIQTLQSSNIKSIPPEEEMFINRMNIAELLESNWSPDLQEYIVTVRAKITSIDNYFGWNYVSCNSCARKVKPSNGVYMCEYENKECKFPLVKYKIQLMVADETKGTTFVLINTVAEKLLDTSAHKLLNRLPFDSNDVPLQIQNLCNKDFVFKLKLSSYNLIEGLHNFTVSKLFFPDEKLESVYRLKNDKKKKGKVVDAESVSADVKCIKGSTTSSEKGLLNKIHPANGSLGNLEDSDADEPAGDGITCKKKRKGVIEDDDEDN